MQRKQKTYKKLKGYLIHEHFQLRLSLERSGYRNMTLLFACISNFEPGLN